MPRIRILRDTKRHPKGTVVDEIARRADYWIVRGYAELADTPTKAVKKTTAKKAPVKKTTKKAGAAKKKQG